jgi:predicted PurR-regulated permease PerM
MSYFKVQMMADDTTKQARGVVIEVLSSSPLLKGLLISLGILVWVAVIFWFAGHIAQAIALLAIGALLADTLYPVIKFLEKVMPRFLAIALVYILLVGGLAVLLYFIIVAIIGQLTSLIGYIQTLISSNGHGQLQPVINFLNRYGIGTAQLKSYAQQLLGQLEGVVTSIVPLATNVFGFYVNMVLVALFSIYFVLYGPAMTHWLRTKTPESQRGRIDFLLKTLRRVVGGYIRGTVLLALIIGVLMGIGLAIIGIPYAFLLAVFAFALEFLPVLGVYITSIAILAVALTQGWITALITLVFLIVVETLENNILTPRIVGRAVGLNPIITIFALLAGVELFGIIGGLFSTPIVGMIQAIIVAWWQAWKKRHPEQFPEEQSNAPSSS